MDKFTKVSAVAAPMPMINIDTDMIIPKNFLKTIKRSGLGKNLFHEMRFDDDGQPKPDFILNKPPYDRAGVIVARDNFGCGSSREHAPWALKDFGIKVVIAPSFADIFYNNCFKNGLLPIALPEEQVEEILTLVADEDSAEISVDLEQKQIIAGNKVYPFDLDDFRRQCLLEGLDDIGLTMKADKDIDQYEQAQRSGQPWLFDKNGDA
ncbi:MAG: 3-isopropylmalate dehydratase small subunit [Alphaproteobacteria bacterium]